MGRRVGECAVGFWVNHRSGICDCVCVVAAIWSVGVGAGGGCGVGGYLVGVVGDHHRGLWRCGAGVATWRDRNTDHTACAAVFAVVRWPSLSREIRADHVGGADRATDCGVVGAFTGALSGAGRRRTEDVPIALRMVAGCCDGGATARAG